MSMATESSRLDALDDLDSIRARARLLELALLGSGKSLKGAYLDAVTQQASDVAHQLDQLAERMGGKAEATTS
jgi:hypothetical protein